MTEPEPRPDDRKSFRVSLHLVADFPGVGYGDAADGACMALRQLGQISHRHRLGWTDTGHIIKAMELGTAARNGYVVVMPPHAIRPSDDPVMESPAPRERLEEAARWLAERADPDGPGVEQEGGLGVANLIDNPQAAYFAWASVVDRPPADPINAPVRRLADVDAERAIADEHLRVIEHAARLRRQEW